VQQLILFKKEKDQPLDRSYAFLFTIA